ncbi:uncharacterized protein LOC123014282 [Tribolium madens]|uniref:uncharacterized protein LOC123014282 n=1 Tax=Tribolium madens TaxID=41895 RepID=UPI001CF766C9|nr:uncharacterized protein LOC123014282 [Tribolium madens]
MDMEKMLEEYRQAQRIRISRKLLANNKAMTLVQFRKVQVQDGDGPCFKDVTMEIRKGTHPDPAAKFNLIIVGCSFIFNDKLPCEKQLKIIFDEQEGEEERREDIHLSFATADLKNEWCGGFSKLFGLEMRNQSSKSILFVATAQVHLYKKNHEGSSNKKSL